MNQLIECDLFVRFIHLQLTFWRYTYEQVMLCFTTGPGALVQWLKLPAWKVGDRGLEPRSGIQVSKKHNVSSPLTREDSRLWRAPVTSDRQGANLSYVYTNVAYNPIHFI